MVTRGVLEQGGPNSVLEGRCHAEFSSSPNQTHLKQLIKVLLGILETSLQDTGPPGPSLQPGTKGGFGLYS